MSKIKFLEEVKVPVFNVGINENTDLTNGSMTQGIDCIVSAEAAHAEGNASEAHGKGSHAEGYDTLAGCKAYYYRVDNDNHKKIYLCEDYLTNTSDLYNTTNITKVNVPEHYSVGQGVGIQVGLKQIVSTISEINNTDNYMLLADNIDLDSNWENKELSTDQRLLFVFANLHYLEEGLVDEVGIGTHSEGVATYAVLAGSHAEGIGTHTSGYGAHSEGQDTKASGMASHAEGNITKSEGQASHAEGQETYALGPSSHAEGFLSRSEGWASHAEGSANRAIGDHSHAEGHFAESIGESSHAEGSETYAEGNYSHAEGSRTVINLVTYKILEQRLEEVDDNDDDPDTKIYWTYYYLDTKPKDIIVGDKVSIKTDKIFDNIGTVVKVGDDYIACDGQLEIPLIENPTKDQNILYTNADCAHAEGIETKASRTGAHAEGYLMLATGKYSHAEGEGGHVEEYSGGKLVGEWDGEAEGIASHSEGYRCWAQGNYAHAEGDKTAAVGDASHTEGQSTKSFGKYSHAEGLQAQAHGLASHSEGRLTYATGTGAHAEGVGSRASGDASHAEGYKCIVGDLKNEFTKVKYAHAEGQETHASKEGAHAEGFKTTASGVYSHTEGMQTTASGDSAHAEGYNTVASGQYSHAEGVQTKTRVSRGYYLTGKIEQAYSTDATGIKTPITNTNTIWLTAFPPVKCVDGEIFNQIPEEEDGVKFSVCEYPVDKNKYNVTLVMDQVDGDLVVYRNCARILRNNKDGSINVAFDLKVCGVDVGGFAEEGTPIDGVATIKASYTDSARAPKGTYRIYIEYEYDKGGIFDVGEHSHVGGYFSRTSHKNSFAHGEGLMTTASNQAVFGRYNSYDQSDCRETSKLLVVGNGVGETERSDAFSVQSENGVCSITVGNTTITEEQLGRLINFLDTLTT